MMRDLPPTPFTEVSYKRLKVDRNWHIACDYQYYSVPFQLVGESVTVRLTPQLVSIFLGEPRVAAHTRRHGVNCRASPHPQQVCKWVPPVGRPGRNQHSGCQRQQPRLPFLAPLAGYQDLNHPRANGLHAH